MGFLQGIFGGESADMYFMLYEYTEEGVKKAGGTWASADFSQDHNPVSACKDWGTQLRSTMGGGTRTVKGTEVSYSLEYDKITLFCGSMGMLDAMPEGRIEVDQNGDFYVVPRPVMSGGEIVTSDEKIYFMDGLRQATVRQFDLT